MNGSPPSLKILLSAYACEPNRGSEPGVGWNWMLALLRRGHQVWVLTRRNNRERIEEACRDQALPIGSRLHFVYFDLPRWASFWKRGARGVQFYYALWQRAVLPVAMAQHRLHKFDVVHHLTFGVWRQPSYLHELGTQFIFGPVGGGEEAPWALVRTLPSWDIARELLRCALNRIAIWNPALRKCLRRAGFVYSKTPETAVWIERAGGRCEAGSEIGIDTQRILVPQPDPASGPLRCIYAGRLVGLKGVHLAIDAIGQAVDRGADVCLTIVGEGPMGKRLRRRAVELGIAGRVRFIDWLSQDNLFDRYREHDLLIFASLHDSSGNVVLEAAAHGLPTLCLQLGGPGVMVDKRTGFPVSAQAASSADEVVQQMADVLVACSLNRDQLAGLSALARANALARSWDAAVNRVYDELDSYHSRSERATRISNSTLAV